MALLLRDRRLFFHDLFDIAIQFHGIYRLTEDIHDILGRALVRELALLGHTEIQRLLIILKFPLGACGKALLQVYQAAAVEVVGSVVLCCHLIRQQRHWAEGEVSERAHSDFYLVTREILMKQLFNN